MPEILTCSYKLKLKKVQENLIFIGSAPKEILARKVIFRKKCLNCPYLNIYYPFVVYKVFTL